MLRQNLQNLVTRFYKTPNDIEDYRDTLIKDREPLPQIQTLPIAVPHQRFPPSYVITPPPE